MLVCFEGEWRGLASSWCPQFSGLSGETFGLTSS